MLPAQGHERAAAGLNRILKKQHFPAMQARASREPMTMRAFYIHSIRQELTAVILMTGILAVSLASLGFGLYQRVSYRATMVNELATLADTMKGTTNRSENKKDSSEPRHPNGLRQKSFWRHSEVAAATEESLCA
jgi:hypothetical protein